MKKTIGIIGFGNFGTLVAAILSKQAEVLVWNRSVNDEVEKRAEKLGVNLVDLKTAAACDIVILTVAISVTEEIIKTIALLVKPGALVMDTCSVKVHPVKWLKKYLPKNVEILGTHPMFGPVTTKFDIDKKYFELAGKQIVLCPVRISKSRLNKIDKFLRSLKLEVIETTPVDHDRQNAKTLSFVHFIGRALTRAEIVEQKIYTPGYADLLKIIPHTNSDKWQLFCDMHQYNDYSQKVRDKFTLACDSLENDLTRAIIKDDLEYNRKMIDSVDARIMQLLEQRMTYVKNIGKIKKEKGMKILDKKREEEILKSKFKQTKLEKSFIKSLFSLIFKESRKMQE